MLTTGYPDKSRATLAMTRILIADDHDVVSSGLRRVLEAQPGCEVVAKAADGKDAIGKAAATTPDVAVLDSMMPLVNGVEAARQIRGSSAQDRSIDLHDTRRRCPSSQLGIFTDGRGRKLTLSKVIPTEEGKSDWWGDFQC